ncbi:MAG: VOC family protein [Thermodesulfobacteriota bacterium]
MELTPFHIAVQVRNIDEAKEFYGKILGFPEGRSDTNWVDFNMFGHQFVCHLNPNLGKSEKIKSHYNPVDGHGVPVPHAGVILEIEDWGKFAEKVNNNNIKFIVEPYTRFEGESGEQSTMFFLDPSGNALEFKAFKNIEDQLFKK